MHDLGVYPWLKKPPRNFSLGPAVTGGPWIFRPSGVGLCYSTRMSWNNALGGDESGKFNSIPNRLTFDNLETMKHHLNSFETSWKKRFYRFWDPALCGKPNKKRFPDLKRNWWHVKHTVLSWKVCQSLKMDPKPTGIVSKPQARNQTQPKSSLNMESSINKFIKGLGFDHHKKWHRSFRNRLRTWFPFWWFPKCLNDMQSALISIPWSLLNYVVQTRLRILRTNRRDFGHCWMGEQYWGTGYCIAKYWK